MKTIRIGCGQGFWGDWLEAPINLLRQGPLDYLVLDYLAEVTMSVLVKQKQRIPEAGYARDFVDLVGKIGPELASRDVKIIANAGGVNPLACGVAVQEILRAGGLSDKLRIAVVLGDNIFPEIDSLIRQGESFQHLDNKKEFSTIRSELTSANVYLGYQPVVDALQGGAQIVITGRVADPSMVLAPMVHEFSWSSDDWDRLSAGIVAGHIIECGAQCSGGNCSLDWQNIPDLAEIGYPVVEANESGEFVVTKHEGTGGRINLASVKEQLVYEIGDPARYLTPDVVADFTSIQLSDAGLNRVKVSGIRGTKKPEKLKVSCSFFTGYRATGTILYSWPEAYEKAAAAFDIVHKRLSAVGALPARMHWEAVGANACHGHLAISPTPDLAEVQLRIAVFDPQKSVVERFTREMASLVLNGPPSATAYIGGKGEVKETYAYWPTLIDRTLVKAEVRFL